MLSRIERIVISLAFALLAAGTTLIVVNAQDATPPAPQQQATLDCTTCHGDYQVSLQNGLHGQAGNDPIFLESWMDQGQPGACLICHNTGYDPITGTSEADTITCAACHNPVPANHPEENMPVDKTTDLCGKCHSDSRFTSSNWTTSAHYQRAIREQTRSGDLRGLILTLSHRASLQKDIGQSDLAQDLARLGEDLRRVATIEESPKPPSREQKDAST